MSEDLSEEELRELLEAAEANQDASSSESSGLPSFDFKRQQRINTEQKRVLEGIHQQFASLSAASVSRMTRLVIDAELVNCNQLPYGDFLLSLGNPCAGYSYVIDPPGVPALLTISSELITMVIDRSFGGQARGGQHEPRTLTQIERGVINTLATSIFNDLETAWETSKQIEVRDVSFESNPDFIQIAGASDASVILAFELNSKGISGQIHLCYPLATLDPLLPPLAPLRPANRTSRKPHMVQTQQTGLDKAQVPVVVELAHSYISLKDLSDLQKGDVVKLDTRKNDPAVVFLGKRPKFLAQPGLKDKHRVVKITSLISAAEEEKYQ